MKAQRCESPGDASDDAQNLLVYNKSHINFITSTTIRLEIKWRAGSLAKTAALINLFALFSELIDRVDGTMPFLMTVV